MHLRILVFEYITNINFAKTEIRFNTGLQGKVMQLPKPIERRIAHEKIRSNTLIAFCGYITLPCRHPNMITTTDDIRCLRTIVFVCS